MTSLKEAEARLRAREAELLAAKRIQEHLWPHDAPRITGFEVAGASWPAELAGGDHFDCLELPDGSFGVVIGDVSGDGFSSSLLLASIHAHLRSFASTHEDPADIVRHMNALLCAETERFATLLFARLEVSSGQLTYVNAGHPPAYLVDRSGTVRAELGGVAIPLAVVEQTCFPLHGPLQLQTGDALLPYTDGLLEAQSVTGEFFGNSRVLEAVRESRDRSSRETVDHLHAAVRSFVGREKLEDDVTLVVIKRMAPATT